MNIEEITDEIRTLEQSETNWANIQRLAWLYTVFDHLTNKGLPVIANEVQAVMPDYAGEFGEAASGKDIGGLMNVLSEHFGVIKVLHPKEYDAVIEKVREIP